MPRFNKNLIARLHNWGLWDIQGCSQIGYASMTAEARLTESPGRAKNKKPQAPVFRQDADAREVDTAMHDITAHYHTLLRLKYRLRRSDDMLSVYINPSDPSMSQVAAQLDAAHRAIAVRLQMPAYDWHRRRNWKKSSGY